MDESNPFAVLREQAIEIIAPIVEEMESRYPEKVIARAVVDAMLPLFATWVPLEQHQRAIMNVMQMDTLRRSEEERQELKQELRRAEDYARRVYEAAREVVEQTPGHVTLAPWPYHLPLRRVVAVPEEPFNRLRVALTEPYPGETFTTATGRELAEEDFERLAGEAEEEALRGHLGYDLDAS